MVALDVLWVFLRLGVTSFGGPIAHLAYFREAFVVQRGWLSEREYAGFVALCQALPGPASSQVGFAIGLRRAGLLGGLAAWVGFTAPSAVIMAGLAIGIAPLEGPIAAALLNGLKLVTAVMVAHALVGMARTLLVTRLSWALAAATPLCGYWLWTVPALAFAHPIAPLTAIVVCAGIALFATPTPSGPPMAQSRLQWRASAAVVVAILVGVLAAPLASGPIAALAAGAFKAGALVFGGGHVVLPLLQLENARLDLIPADDMVAAYGAAQLMPGPLFSIASFLGMASAGPAGAAMATLAIFLPGLALVWALAPLWAAYQDQPRMRAALTGANAAVVGFLAATLAIWILPAITWSWTSLAIAGLGFAALQWVRAPMLMVALAVAVAGAVASPVLWGNA